MLIIALTLGVWHNLAIMVLWWAAANNSWNVLVDFNSRGEAKIEGLLTHMSLAFLLIALIYITAALKSEQPLRESKSSESLEAPRIRDRLSSDEVARSR